MKTFVWKCCNCGCRVMLYFDCLINERPICVQCNCEMEPQLADPDAGKVTLESVMNAYRRIGAVES